MKKIFLSLIILGCFTASSAFAAYSTDGDGTVFDEVTGLMWQQATATTTAGNGEFLWANPAGCAPVFGNETGALCYCENLPLATYTDWRLPDRNELHSLIDYTRAAAPFIDPLFSDTLYGEYQMYWSATTNNETPTQAHAANFGSGYMLAPQSKTTDTSLVRCVRGRFYRITSTALGNGTITPDGDVEGNYGTAVTYTMAPDTGETITEIVVDSETVPPPTGGYVQDQSETYEFLATTAGQHAIIATFAVTHSITVTNGTGCTINPAGPVQRVVDGGDITFDPIGAIEHYTLTDVLVDGTSQGAITEYTFTNVTTDDGTIETQCTEDAKYAMTVAVTGQGNVTSAPLGIDCPDGGACTFNYYENSEVALTATPAAGMAFNGWGGACTGTDTCTVTMNEAKNVTAEFGDKSSLLLMIMGVIGGTSGR